MQDNNLCPVCGFKLGFKAWNNEIPSDEICPCCGIQFGLDDNTQYTQSMSARSVLYIGWRSKWKLDGMQWWSQNTLPPTSWNPKEQIKQLFKAALKE